MNIYVNILFIFTVALDENSYKHLQEYQYEYSY